MLNILPEDVPRFYYAGEWFQIYEWVEETGGALSKMDERFHILFSNKELKRDVNWDIYAISVSKFGKSIILNDMYDIHSTPKDPHIIDIIALYKKTPYLQGLNPKQIFFMSDVKNYKALTTRILSIINGTTIIWPIHYYT